MEIGDNMIKKIMCLFIILITTVAYVYAENNQLEYKPLTREEIGTEISIPNRDGEWDTYANINTFEDLYSVLEDLSVDYKYILEQKWNLEGKVEELEEENENLRDQIHTFENGEGYEAEESYFKEANKSHNFVGILISIIICLIIYIIILKSRKMNGGENG